MVMKVYGMDISSNCIPIFGLLKENGIKYDFVSVDLSSGDNKTPEYLAKNPLHCIPTMDEDGFTMWESRAILRYVANSYGLESWYPSDPSGRAVIDLALDFHMNSFYGLATKSWLYPKFKWVKEGPTPEEVTVATRLWEEDVSKAFQHILSLNDGPLIGGKNPSIADLAFFGLLGQLITNCPDCPISKSSFVARYFESLKAKLPRYADYLKSPV